MRYRVGAMPSSDYYHRQADMYVRMTLSANANEERIRLLDRANEYRDRAAHAEALGRAPKNVSRMAPRHDTAETAETTFRS
jgi:hypothetical protein